MEEGLERVEQNVQAKLARQGMQYATLRQSSTNEVIDMRNLTFELAFENPDGGAWKQGWDVQPKTVDEEHPLTIFVVPHSHNDPGWIKTFDEYFKTQTKQIITTVVEALLQDKQRKFIWAEISYFAWWWDEQSDERKQQVKQLLNNGQLEFVTGGWVQPDEANSQLYAMEVQLQEGHDWIRSNVGSQFIPQYGWAIDPFGYSPTMAYLLKKYNFRAMLIQRVHYAVKKELAKRKHLEFTWRQTWDNTGKYDILCHVMPFFSYDVPHTCGPDPSVCCQFDYARHPYGPKEACPWHKNPQAITDANVKERSMLLLDQYQKKAALYRSNVVIAPLGDDFRYQTASEAENQYTNYQKIFDYLNANVPGISIQFGTLSDYFQAIRGTFDPPMLKGSFFTYSDVNEDYWSGYFTSRIFDKALDRQLERVLYAAEAMGGTKLELQQPRRALSLFQHHDGVTGTAKTHVVEDYARIMFTAIHRTQEYLQSKLPPALSGPEIKHCWKASEPRGLPQNACGESGEVIVYNPLETPQSCGDQLIRSHSFTKAQLPCERPGLVSGSSTKVVFDMATGLMKEPIREEWKVWKVSRGGAYLFFPGQMGSYDIRNNGQLEILDDGFVVTTDKWKRTVIEHRIPTEFGTTATVLDFIYETNLEQDNQEWFVRFSGNIANRGVFHTDLNGFNFDTHHFRHDMPIQSQVFPMPTMSSIEDDETRLTVLSEHAQGTASLQDGSIDVWLDRRLRQDDNRGLGQGVQDNRPTRTRFRVVIEHEGYNTDIEFDVTKLCRRMWEELQHPLELFGKHVLSMETYDEPVDPEEFRKKQERIRAERDEKRKVMVDEQRRQAREADVGAGMDDDKTDESKAGGQEGGLLDRFFMDPVKQLLENEWLDKIINITNKPRTATNTIVPFVYMVHKRAEYLKRAIESLRASDFPKSRVPLIISHDGHVPEVVEYVESLKGEFNIIQLFHPFSCYDHPNSFPGDDPKLNEGFNGDSYGNPRSPWATCAKHHFTWMMKACFDRNFKAEADHFLFLEEDYIVAPTIYTAVVSGLNVMDAMENKTDGGFFGIGLDPTEADVNIEPTWIGEDSWYAAIFHSGPMTLSRPVFAKIVAHAEEYCKFDDYNWDWTMIHLQGQGYLPHTLLMPSRQLAMHIGTKEGMHAEQYQLVDMPDDIKKEFDRQRERLTTDFVGDKFAGDPKIEKIFHPRGYGGWGHPADHEHCLQVLQA